MFHFVHALLFLNTKDKIYYLVIKMNCDKKKSRIVVGDDSGVTCFLCWKLVSGLSAARHAHVSHTA